MTARQTYSIDEIKALLAERAEDVAMAYAPMAAGGWRDGYEYWTLNPGRADNEPGSFVIYIGGPRAGQWADFAMRGRDAYGDLIDLIRLNLGCSMADALREARRYLGLAHDSPEDAARRKDAAKRRQAQQRQAKQDAAERAFRKARAAHRLWLSAEQRLRGTPVDQYLRDTRRIDLDHLGRQPGSLRYHPALKYQHIDRKTGEVIEGTYPAMVAIVNDLSGNALAVHRTWLAFDPAKGRWDKAPVPKAKKVMGNYAGGAIHISRGSVEVGPRGGRAPGLRGCLPGAHVYLTEGIEDALSVCMVLPHVRVIAGISLSNLGGVELPRNVATVTIVADRDEGAQAREALELAVQAHARAGREVRLWQNRHGGKDLNDALRQMARKQDKAE